MSASIASTPVALTIAGSDSSCGAGIQADLRMFAASGVFGTTVLTALTAQNPYQVTTVEELSASFVKAQLEAVFDAMPISAVKTGMLWSAEIITTVAGWLAQSASLPSVVDPVMIATSGAKLITEDAIERYKADLLPRCRLMTPNLDEAQVLLGGGPVDHHNQAATAEALGDQFGCAVLLKGGHLAGDPIDLLWDGQQIHTWHHRRLQNVNTHGSGCILSAAITAALAQGNSLKQAVETGLNAVRQALLNPVVPAPDLLLAGIESIGKAN